MPSPSAHALLSASSAHRWMNCTAAPRFEALFPEGDPGPYAAEGTLAHSFCEAYVRWSLIGGEHANDDFSRTVRELEADPLYNPEMHDTARVYAGFLEESALAFEHRPYVAVEQRVDFSRFVPQGFGTCDCIMIADGRIQITDYKHGRGVAVSPDDNPQLKLYALGALELYRPIYGGSIEAVRLAIVQPRLSSEPLTWDTTVAALYEWAEAEVLPKAREAYSGNGSYTAGDWCRFCRGKAQCAARAAKHTALEEFAGLIGKNATPKSDAQKNVLTDEQVADLLHRGETLAAWYADLQAYAAAQLAAGKQMPGYKLVEGRSVRKISDYTAAADLLQNAGYDRALLYRSEPLGLGDLEKLVGKKRLPELLGALIEKPAGRPTMVPASDKRPALELGAAADFNDIK